MNDHGAVGDADDGVDDLVAVVLSSRLSNVINHVTKPANPRRKFS